MSPVFGGRRRAEEFDSLVEDTSAGSVDPGAHAELLELVTALRATPPPEARPEFVADLRERLMTAAETELVPATAPDVRDRLTVARRAPRERRIAIAISGFALVGATTSMAVAAQSALPGDVLYPLKRAIENAHTGLSVNDERKGSTLLANATGRLEEVDRLTRADVPEVDVAAVEQTLQLFTEQATEASDLLITAYSAEGDDRALTELQEFTERSFQALNQLASGATDPVREVLVPVGNTLAAIEAAIQDVCPTCEEVITSLPTWMLTSTEAAVSGLLGELVGPAEENAADAPAPGKDRGRPGRGGTATSDSPGTRPPAAGDDGTGVQPPAPVPGGPQGGTPGGSGGSPGGGDPTRGSNPVTDLVNGLLGTGGSTPAEEPTLPIVGPVLEGVGDLVGGLLDPLKPKPTPKP